MEKFTPEQARMFRKLSQNEVAKLLGISPRTYAYKESGERDFTYTEILKFAKIVNMELSMITPIYSKSDL